MTTRWKYLFEAATSTLSRQAQEVPPRGFVWLTGVDGRYEGHLRRYPGNTRFADSTRELNPGVVESAWGSAHFTRLSFMYLREQVRTLHDRGTGNLTAFIRFKEVDSTGSTTHGPCGWSGRDSDPSAGLNRPGRFQCGDSTDVDRSGVWPEQNSARDILDTGGTLTPNGTWHQIHWTRDTTTTPGTEVNKLYINGVLVNTNTFGSVFDYASGGGFGGSKMAVVGTMLASGSDASFQINGYVTDMGMSSDCWDATAIALHHDSLLPGDDPLLPGNLVAYWALDGRDENGVITDGATIVDGDLGLANTAVGHTSNDLVVGAGAPTWATEGPGIAYSNTSSSGIDDFQPDTVRPFVVPESPQSNQHVRGFFVGEKATGKVEIWYRQDSEDAVGVMHKQQLRNWQGRNMYLVDPTTSASFDDGVIGTLGGGMNAFQAVDPGSSNVALVKKLKVLNYQGIDQLFAVGVFTEVGGRACYGVARWDGRRWNPVGDGLLGMVHDITVFDDTLFCCGVFTAKLDGTPCRRLAKLDGSNWTEFGGGTDGETYCLETFEVGGFDKLWVGGAFTEVDNITPVTSAGLAYSTPAGVWTSTEISTDKFNNSVLCLKEWDDGGTTKLYVGGSFTNTPLGTTTSQRLIRYDNTGTPEDFVPSTDINGTVRCFGETGQDAGDYLLVGGDFTQVSGSATPVVNHTTRWNDTAFSAIGSGTITNADQVHSITYAPEADAVIASTVKSSNGAAPFIASYTGGAWVTFNGATGDRLDTTSATYTTQAAVFTVGGEERVIVAGKGNKVLTPHTGLPWPTEVTEIGYEAQWDIATRGPYIYFLTEFGNHMVFTFSTELGYFTTDQFGPQVVALPQPDADKHAVSGGWLIRGGYQGAWRYYDVERARRSQLSPRSQADGVLLTSDKESYIMDGGTAGPYTDFPVSYLGKKIELFSTISSGFNTERTASFDPDVDLIGEEQVYPAGGVLFNAGSIAVVPLKGLPPVDIGRQATSNEEIPIGVSDSSLAADPTPYNPLLEEVRELGSVVAVAHYQRSTFCLEEREGYYDLRWSPTHRLEPENFPAINYFPTRIHTRDVNTCRMVLAGDFLYVFGGACVYRVQKAGQAVGVVEVVRGYPIIHRDGIVVVGSTIYVATEMGILTLDARTGNPTFIDALSTMFTDRWRRKLVVGDEEDCLKACYDSKMECIYFLHRNLQETLCLWLGTGKMTALQGCPFQNCTSTEDVNLGTSERAFWFNERHMFFYPNWDPVLTTDVLTMTGTLIRADDDTLYNCEVLDVDTDLNLVYVSNGKPGPFTYDPTDDLREIGPLYVAVLSGANKYRLYLTSDNSSNALISASLADAVEPGDIIALSPIPFGVLGAPLWAPNGAWNLENRKVTTGTTPALYRTSSVSMMTASDPAVYTVPEDVPVFSYGTVRPNDLTPVGSYPLTTFQSPLWPYTYVADGTRGVAPSVDKPSLNATRINSDGTCLMPWLWCLLSDLHLELHQWVVVGDFEASLISGPGTS